MDSMTFFAFPLNLILALIWLLTVCLSYKHARGSKIVCFMLSPAASIISIALLAAFCLVIGLSGNRNLSESWPFILAMLFFMTVLAFVLVRGWKSGGKPRWRFILNHAGLLLALSSAFWGAPDLETLRFQAFMDTPVREAYRMDGSRVWLPCEVELKNFDVRLSGDGTPSHFAAEVIADGEKVVLQVNHPYQLTFASDLYLTSYDPEDGRWCILQLVYEPWKYPALAGIIMMLAGAVILFIQGPRKTQMI